jgi:hypothetical protein
VLKILKNVKKLYASYYSMIRIYHKSVVAIDPKAIQIFLNYVLYSQEMIEWFSPLTQTLSRYTVSVQYRVIQVNNNRYACNEYLIIIK